MSTISQAMKDARQVHYLVAFEFGGLVKRYAMRDIAVPYSTGNPMLFEGSVLEEIEVSSRFDFRSLTYASQKVSLTLANADRLQDEETRVKLDGGIGSVYVWAPGLDWADIETHGLVYKGITELDSYDRHRIKFSLSDVAGRRWKTIPETMINTGTWPSARIAGGGGSVMGLPQALVFGSWTKGIPLKCVDTAAFKYLACFGQAKSVDADYTAGTVDAYDKDGAVIDPAGYVFYPGALDAEGNLISYFDFTADKVASEPLSCSIQGYVDGSGEITGTAGNLIEHPADVIYYLMKYHSLLDPGEIHVESIKTMRSLLPGISLASIVNLQVSGADVIGRILSQCGASPLTMGGKAGVMIIATDGPNLGALRWDHHLIGKGAKISKTPADDIINRVRCKYALNPATGKWEGEFTRDRTNDAACEESYYDYGEQPEYTLELADVQEELTARALASRLIGLKAQRHDIAEIEVPFWDGFDLREGDAALLTLREGASPDGSGWSEEKCILIERTLKRHTITQKWWRVAA